jgi:Tfp pilus assembly protein PilV
MTSHVSSTSSAFRQIERKSGFSLVEVLFACTLLALALVPLMRASGNNRRTSETLRDLVKETLKENDASACQAAEASVARAMEKERREASSSPTAAQSPSGAK